MGKTKTKYKIDMRIEHIKANGECYMPREKGIQNPNYIEGCHYPVCYIKKLWFGRWQIDYCSDMHDCYDYRSYVGEDENIPNVRLIVYPSGIEEIRWLY